MKNSFNFLQFANWLFVCRENIIRIREQVATNELTKEQAIEKLLIEKKHISTLIAVLDRGANIHGIQSSFLRNLKEIKKQYDIEE